MAVGAELWVYFPEPVSLALIATSVVSIVGTAAGTYTTYRVNHAGDNRDFIARSVCLALPVGIRVIVASIVVYFAYLIVGSIVGGDAFEQFTTHITWIDVAFICVVLVVYYWRLCRHFTWIARPHDAA